MADKGFTRRDFLKTAAGTVGLLAVSGLPLQGLLKHRNANEHEAATDSRVQNHRAWCMVIDLAKCDGCTGLGLPPQCTQACVNGHFAPKGQQWIEVYTKEMEGGGHFFLPTPCYQCENAPCVNVCPVAATYHEKDGVVLIDHNRCIGCRMCMAACPYQRRFFNWRSPELPPEAAFAEYSPLYPVPARKGTVIKCMFCDHLLMDGKLPFCVTGCPRKVLYIGDLNEDIASNGAEVVKLSKFLDDHNAYRYKEDLGTQPRVYYLPGYGQEFGRKPEDPKEIIPVEWKWGGEGDNENIGLWPWGNTPK